MDCQDVEFSPTKSKERINRALKVFPRALLMRLLAFALHLMGASRRAVATLVDMPEESVKTVVRLALRDGFAALRDRRRSGEPSVSRVASVSSLQMSVRREKEWCVVEAGPTEIVKIPVTNQVQARTVLLSFVNAGGLSVRETAIVLGISATHCGGLARKLASEDVVEALVDKRQGQKRDYRVGSEQKAEIIQQMAARVIAGRSTSSDVLAKVVNEQAKAELSPRTIRWHINKLGLANMKKTLPELVEALKKTS